MIDRIKNYFRENDTDAYIGDFLYYVWIFPTAMVANKSKSWRVAMFFVSLLWMFVVMIPTFPIVLILIIWNILEDI